MPFDVDKEIAEVRAEVLAGNYAAAGERCACILDKTEHGFARFILGFSYAQRGKYGQALDNFHKAKELGLVDWSLELYIARSLDALQNSEDALINAHASLALSPANSEVIIYILNLMAKMQKFEDAELFYKNLDSECRTDEVWAVLSELKLVQGNQKIDKLLKNGEFLEAKKTCSRLLKESGKARYLRRRENIENYERWVTYVQKRRTENPKRTKPLLTVLLITYNHENFIGQAIQSVIDQETEYDIRIDVVEDCSSDRTRDVILAYKKKYPHIIKTYFNPTNLGTLDPPQQKVTYAGLKRLDGDYICILEGDDYWSDKTKVQKQISFLEANPGYAAAAHNTVKIYENGLTQAHRFIYQDSCKETHNVEDFIAMTSFFHTTSIIYRNVLCDNIPKEFASKWSCDIFNTIAHVEKGDLYYMDLDMSVYRAHSGGNYSNMPAKMGRIFNIEGLRQYNKWLGYRYSREFSETIHRLCHSLIEDSDKNLIEKITSSERRYFRAIAQMHKIFLYLSQKFPFLTPATLFHGEPVSRGPSKKYVKGDP